MFIFKPLYWIMLLFLNLYIYLSLFIESILNLFLTRLLLKLIRPLLFLSFFLYLDYLFSFYMMLNIISHNLFNFLLSSAFFLISLYMTFKYFKVTIKIYKDFTKNNFIDTYVFPEELSKLLSKKYPHLLEHEVVEILKMMKEFYRFQTDEKPSEPSYMPSLSVDFACKTFSNMPKSSRFFKRISLSEKKYYRVLPKATTINLNEVTTHFLSEHDKEQINPKIFEIWCYCCKKEDINPFSPQSFPYIFTLDEKLKIPSGFLYKFNEVLSKEKPYLLETPTLSELKHEIEDIANIPDFIDLRYEKELIQNIENIEGLAQKIQYYLGLYSYTRQYQRKELEELFQLIDENKSLASAVYKPYRNIKLFKKAVLDNSAPPPPNLFLELIHPILYLCFFLLIDFSLIFSIIQSIYQGLFFNILVQSIFILILLSITIGKYKDIIEIYKGTTKNYFLDTYLFPKELAKILREKYPHLKKTEVEEVLEAIKEFYRFQINKDPSIPRYMPSHVVDFACQTLFDMPNSSLFFKKFSFLGKKYNRVIAKSTSTSSKETIAVLLAGQYEEQTNSRISEMWCYCCKKEYIDPFFPLSFPSLFTIDKRLKIPSGFTYELDETQFRETHPIKEATSISYLRYELQTLDERPRVDIDYLAKRIQYYLGRYDYCHQYQREEFEKLFRVIEKNKPLAHAVYGQYSDANIFIQTVLDSSAPPPPENPGCCSGASI